MEEKEEMAYRRRGGGGGRETSPGGESSRQHRFSTHCHRVKDTSIDFTFNRKYR